MSTAITTTKEPSMIQIIAEAAKSADIDVMQKLVDLQFRIMDEERTRVLNESLAKFEPMLTTLVKSKAGAKTKDGKIKFWYTPIDDIDRMIRKPLRECGLSLSFTTRVIADKPYFVTQVQESTKGGIKESMLPYMPDTNDQLNAPQKVSSGLSFAERRGITMLFNLVFADEDDNAQFAGAINTSQVGQIERALNECERFPSFKRSEFLDFIERDWHTREITLIPAQAFNDIESKLKSKLTQLKKIK